MMFGDQQTIDPIFGQIATASGSDTTVGVMELEATSAGRALVVIVDDRTAHGDNTDSIGPLVTELLNEAGFLVDATVAVAPTKWRSATLSTPQSSVASTSSSRSAVPGYPRVTSLLT